MHGEVLDLHEYFIDLKLHFTVILEDYYLLAAIVLRNKINSVTGVTLRCWGKGYMD